MYIRLLKVFQFLLFLPILAINAPQAWAQGCDHHHEDDNQDQRDFAKHQISWRHSTHRFDRVEKVRLLAFNDFHGQLSTGRFVAGRPVGSAPVMAAYFTAAAESLQGHTFIVHAGDHVGASPSVSALLQDEPSITFMNMVGNRWCSERWKENPRCNLVATAGNHEFDEGKGELLRLINGGNHAKGPFLETPWRGAQYPLISSNVVKEGTTKTLLPAYNIKFVDGIPVAFIGAVLKETPTIVTPTGVAGLTFLDEAKSINKQAAILRRMGIRTMIVLIHQGGSQPAFTGPTPENPTVVTGEIQRIVDSLSDDIDVVVSGHTHQFTNAFMKNANGKTMLVTQSFSSSTAFGQVDLDIDRKSRDVVAMSGRIITTWADVAPGNAPDPAVRAMVDQAEARVAPMVNQVVGTAAIAITRTQNTAGESALGNLIADAQRASMGTDFAFMNPGGIRADLNLGTITWGSLFTIQPFANDVVKMKLTGAQIYTLLNQQWVGQTSPRMMQISGLTYTWDNSLPIGSKVVEVRRGGLPIGLVDEFTLACNSFMAAGGDNFLILKAGTERIVGPVDLDALVQFVSNQTLPIDYAIEGRIVRFN
jgi:5'-nucleotidase